MGISTLLKAVRPGGRNQLRETMARRLKRITVKPFMDMNTMLEERLLQCCVHVGTKSADNLDQCAPFCAVQAWPPLGRTKMSERAGAQVGTVPLTLRPNSDAEVRA